MCEEVSYVLYIKPNSPVYQTNKVRRYTPFVEFKCLLSIDFDIPSLSFKLLTMTISSLHALKCPNSSRVPVGSLAI